MDEDQCRLNRGKCLLRQAEHGSLAFLGVGNAAGDDKQDVGLAEATGGPGALGCAGLVIGFIDYVAVDHFQVVKPSEEPAFGYVAYLDGVFGCTRPHWT